MSDRTRNSDATSDERLEEAEAVAGNSPREMTLVNPDIDSRTDEANNDTAAEDTTASTEDVSDVLDADTLTLSIFSIDYTERDDNAVIHLRGRNEAGKLRHVEVPDFEPYFFVPATPDVRDIADEQWNVVDITPHEKLTDHDALRPGHSIREDAVMKVQTKLPKHVSYIRDEFESHYEADILFPDRFLIDKGITEGVTVDLTHDDVQSLSEDEEPIDDLVKLRAPQAAVEPASVDADPRVHMADIEVDDRQGFPENGEEPILCLTTYDSYDDEYLIWVAPPEDAETGDVPRDLHYDPLGDNIDYEVRPFPTEEAMLAGYLNYVQKTSPSIMSGWNFTDFDVEYLINRLEQLDENRNDDRVAPDRLSPVNEYRLSNWDPEIKCRTVLDLLQAFKRTEFTERESYRLDAVGEDVLGAGKETYLGAIGDLWENDMQQLLEYNLRDVEICVELDNQKSVIDFWEEVRKFVGCQIGDAPIPSQAVDAYILHVVSDTYVLPSKGQQEGEPFDGGAVFEPIAGIKQNVATLDLKSLYPMCMLTINASPETKVCPDTYGGDTFQAPNGVEFRKDRNGMLREIIENLLKRREEKKARRSKYEPGTNGYETYDQQQAAIKVIMNSLFGILGYDRFRLYDEDAAGAVTATGREVIRYTQDQVESEYGYEVVYGDTDSCLVSLPTDLDDDELIELGYKIETYLNECYDKFAARELNAQDEHRFEMEFEKLYRKFLQAGKKKRYAGHVIFKDGKKRDEIDLKGFETNRSDAAPITGETMERVIELILVEDATDKEVIDYLAEKVDEVDNGEVPLEKVAIPSGLNEKLDNYDSRGKQVRGAEYANLVLGTEYGKGSKPKHVELEGITPEMRQYLKEQLNVTPQESEIYREFLTKSDVICFEYPEQLPDDGLIIHWEKMRDKTLKKPIGRVIEPLGISWSEIESGQQQTGLAEFM